MTLDWTAIILALLAGLPPTLAALAAFRKADATHRAVNSRVDAFESTLRADLDKARAEIKLLQAETARMAIVAAAATGRPVDPAATR